MSHLGTSCLSLCSQKGLYQISAETSCTFRCYRWKISNDIMPYLRFVASEAEVPREQVPKSFFFLSQLHLEFGGLVENRGLVSIYHRLLVSNSPSHWSRAQLLLDHYPLHAASTISTMIYDRSQYEARGFVFLR